MVDIVAIPNSDKDFGLTDSITEDDLMEIIEEVMEKHSSTTKLWNLSLGIKNKPCDDAMSDLGVFLDYIQDTYHVQVFVSSGNVNSLPLEIGLLKKILANMTALYLRPIQFVL